MIDAKPETSLESPRIPRPMKRPAETPPGTPHRRPLRVLLVTGEYPPDEGGVADYTQCLAEALAARGLRIDVLTSRREAFASMGAMDGATEEAAKRGRRITVFRSIGRWDARALRGLRSLVERTRPDIVHFQYQAAAFEMRWAIHSATRLLKRAPEVRSAVTYHDLRIPYLWPKAGRMRPWAVRRLARNADLAITTNAADHEELRPDARGPLHALVPIGSNIEDAPPEGYEREIFRTNAGYGSNALVLAYFGFMNESKGGWTLLEALTQLREAGRDARLVMIGGALGASDPTNADYLSRFETEIAKRELGAHVRFTGHLASAGVSAWLHAADLAALPYEDGASFRRGSLLAALRHGLPTVTTWPEEAQISGDAELPALEDGKSVRLIKPGDAAALAATAMEIVDDGALSARLSAEGRALAMHFGWAAIAEQHERLYREVLGDGAAPKASPTDRR